MLPSAVHRTTRAERSTCAIRKRTNVARLDANVLDSRCVMPTSPGEDYSNSCSLYRPIARACLKSRRTVSLKLTSFIGVYLRGRCSGQLYFDRSRESRHSSSFAVIPGGAELS